MTEEPKKYKEMIQDYSFQQLVVETAIVNQQYKKYYGMKKDLEDEFERRLKEETESRR